MKKPDRNYWDRVLGTIADHVEGTLPSVTEIGRDSADPFKVLISTVISLRTKDKVTLESSLRLFARAGTAEDMLKLDEDEIASLIYPAGFYKTKAKNIKEICSRLNEEGGIVPQDRESLLSLPGVGLKTANLVLSQGWGIPAICVDIHVHRIANRMGWVKTEKPDNTEKELVKIVPQDYWIPLNDWLVLFGQQTCTPLSPRCSICPVSTECPRKSVNKSR